VLKISQAEGPQITRIINCSFLAVFSTQVHFVTVETFSAVGPTYIMTFFAVGMVWRDAVHVPFPWKPLEIVHSSAFFAYQGSGRSQRGGLEVVVWWNAHQIVFCPNWCVWRLDNNCSVHFSVLVTLLSLFSHTSTL